MKLSTISQPLKNITVDLLELLLEDSDLGLGFLLHSSKDKSPTPLKWKGAMLFLLS